MRRIVLLVLALFAAACADPVAPRAPRLSVAHAPIVYTFDNNVRPPEFTATAWYAPITAHSGALWVSRSGGIRWPYAYFPNTPTITVALRGVSGVTVALRFRAGGVDRGTPVGIMIVGGATERTFRAPADFDEILFVTDRQEGFGLDKLIVQ